MKTTRLLPITPEEREAFVEGAREIIRNLGVEAAAAFMGAATARVMGTPDVPVQAWNLNEDGDPTEPADPEISVMCRDIEKELFADHEASPEIRLAFAEAVQEAARRALHDLGYRAEIQRPN